MTSRGDPRSPKAGTTRGRATQPTTRKTSRSVKNYVGQDTSFTGSRARTLGLPLGGFYRRANYVTDNAAPVSHATEPTYSAVRARRRDDLCHGFTEPCHQHGFTCLAHAIKHGKAVGLELGDLQLFHFSQSNWSDGMIQLYNAKDSRSGVDSLPCEQGRSVRLSITGRTGTTGVGGVAGPRLPAPLPSL